MVLYPVAPADAIRPGTVSQQCPEAKQPMNADTESAWQPKNGSDPMIDLLLPRRR
ncbi:hypothetical protein [Nocardia sp. NPDC003345]